MEATEVKRTRYLADARARARADETASDTDGSAVKMVTPNWYKNKTVVKRDESPMPPGMWNLTHTMAWRGRMISQWTWRRDASAEKGTRWRKNGVRWWT